MNVFVLRVPNLVGSPHKSLELTNSGLNSELIYQLFQAVRGDDSSVQLSLPLKSNLYTKSYLSIVYNLFSFFLLLLLLAESLIHVIDAANAFRLCIESLGSSLSLNEFKVNKKHKLDVYINKLD